jgi:bis(5'-adenosyl)-triphosphatase
MEFGDHEIPEDHIIIMTQSSFVFTNIRPFLPFHILVSPKARKARIFDLTTEETFDLFNTVRLSLLALRDRCSSYTINIQDGIQAGQTVQHVHIHIVPRNSDDLRRNEDIYDKGAIDCEDRPNREYEVMKEETLLLREAFEGVFSVGGMPIERINPKL